MKRKSLSLLCALALPAGLAVADGRGTNALNDLSTGTNAVERNASGKIRERVVSDSDWRVEKATSGAREGQYAVHVGGKLVAWRSSQAEAEREGRTLAMQASREARAGRGGREGGNPALREVRERLGGRAVPGVDDIRSLIPDARAFIPDTGGMVPGARR